MCERFGGGKNSDLNVGYEKQNRMGIIRKRRRRARIQMGETG